MYQFNYVPRMNQSNYKSRSQTQLNKRKQFSRFMITIKKFLIPKSIIDIFRGIETLDINDAFEILLRSVPLFIDTDQIEEIFQTLSKFVIIFPKLKKFITPSIELDCICNFIESNQNIQGLRFISLIVDGFEIFNFIFNRLIKYLTYNYIYLSNCAKSYGRLFLINCATMELRIDEINDIFHFLNLAIDQEDLLMEEALDFLEILDILSISLIYVPIDTILQLGEIFQILFLKVKRKIIFTKNIEGIYFCLSIYVKLLENEYEIEVFDFEEVLKLVAENEEELPYFFKEIVYRKEKIICQDFFS